MKIRKNILAGLLALMMTLTAGCSGADTSWAYRAEGQTPPIGLYLFYLMDSVSTTEAEYHEQHADNETEAHPPYSKLLSVNVRDGQSFKDVMLETAADSMREHIAIEQKFAEMGLSLTESEWSYAQSTAESVWTSNQALMEKNGISASSVQLAYENGLKKQSIFSATYQSGGSNAISDDTLKAEFDKTFAKVDYLLFPKSVEGGEEAAKADADAYLKKLEDGADLYELAHEQSKAAAVAAGSETEPEAPAEGSHTMILAELYKGSYYSDELVDSALAAEIGKPVIAEDTSYIYILSRRSILEDETDFLSYRDQVLVDLKGDEFEQTVSGWSSAVALETNQAALNKYTPERLKME